MLGILGGGQLGRMLATAGRSLGYRIAVLDPDPACPAAGVADRVEVGGYGDPDAALRMAEGCAVVTYELEHVDAAVVEALEARVPVRPGVRSLRVTQDRLAERRFVASLGLPVAPWQELRAGDDEALGAAAGALGLPLRLKAAFGGYDGRSQVRLEDSAAAAWAWRGLGRPSGEPLLAEAELDFLSELSVVCARALDESVAPYPVIGNRHDEGILVESVVPAAVPAPVAAAAADLAVRIAEALDHVGVLTVELFRLRDDSLVVNELAPRVHNSGHLTIEACATSQFEQHIRAVCGLPLGSAALRVPAAMVNLLGTGPRRPARLEGIADALADPAVHLHLYDKATVFERRKMGHLTAAPDEAGSVEAALARADAARSRLRWADAPGSGPGVADAAGAAEAAVAADGTAPANVAVPAGEGDALASRP
jgi:5-(carboxyamino)imidazole ribonucleotide synthase